MSDMISRQTAISAICNACGKIDCDKIDKCEKLQLPPANSSEFPNSSDTIYRQAAIDALFELYEYQRDIDPTEAADLVRQGIFLAEKKIEQLPSAQPELRRGEGS